MYCTGSSTVNVQVLPLLKIVVLLERVRLYNFVDKHLIAEKQILLHEHGCCFGKGSFWLPSLSWMKN